MSTGEVERAWSPLAPRERRVLGVLVEKQKTTPDVYPMTVTALTTGCNQKSNRDPVTDFDAEQVEETLQALKGKGAVIKVEGMGRVEKWKHNLYEWLRLKSRPAEMAIIAELLLRGPQTEGELRGRASRMDPIDDLAALQGHLNSLVDEGLVVYLTPMEQRRGAIVTHGLYPAAELEQLRRSAASQPRPVEPREEAGAPAADRATLARALASLEERFSRLEEQVRSLASDVQTMKSELGG